MARSMAGRRGAVRPLFRTSGNRLPASARPSDFVEPPELHQTLGRNGDRLSISAGTIPWGRVTYFWPRRSGPDHPAGMIDAADAFPAFKAACVATQAVRPTLSTSSRPGTSLIGLSSTTASRPALCPAPLSLRRGRQHPALAGKEGVTGGRRPGPARRGAPWDRQGHRALRQLVFCTHSMSFQTPIRIWWRGRDRLADLGAHAPSVEGSRAKKVTKSHRRGLPFVAAWALDAATSNSTTAPIEPPVEPPSGKPFSNA